MFSVLTVVLPIFALIFAGWICRRGNILGPLAATEINRFVVYLALPALLFDIVARHYEAMLSHYGTALGVKCARKHLGWYLDGLPSETRVSIPRQAILTENRPAEVLRLMQASLVEDDTRVAA